MPCPERVPHLFRHETEKDHLAHSAHLGVQKEHGAVEEMGGFSPQSNAGAPLLSQSAAPLCCTMQLSGVCSSLGPSLNHRLVFFWRASRLYGRWCAAASLQVDPTVFHMLNEDPGGVSFSEIGGLSEQIRELREVIELPLTNPELFIRVGIKPPKVKTEPRIIDPKTNCSISRFLLSTV